MNQGVEWALHACLNLAWVEPGTAVTARALAEFNDLPAPYLNKQLQALARAGIVTSTPGPRGGFTLARDPGRITVLDVVDAIDGPEPGFVCTEIRQRGPMASSRRDCRTPCEIASVMGRAQQVWRQELAAQTVADIGAEVAGKNPAVPERVRQWFSPAPSATPVRVSSTGRNTA